MLDLKRHRAVYYKLQTSPYNIDYIEEKKKGIYAAFYFTTVLHCTLDVSDLNWWILIAHLFAKGPCILFSRILPLLVSSVSSNGCMGNLQVLLTLKSLRPLANAVFSFIDSLPCGAYPDTTKNGVLCPQSAAKKNDSDSQRYFRLFISLLI